MEDVSHIGNLRQIATTNWTSKRNEFTSVYVTFFLALVQISNRILFSPFSHGRILAIVRRGSNNRCTFMLDLNRWHFLMSFGWLATDHVKVWWAKVALASHFDGETFKMMKNGQILLQIGFSFFSYGKSSLQIFVFALKTFKNQRKLRYYLKNFRDYHILTKTNLISQNLFSIFYKILAIFWENIG